MALRRSSLTAGRTALIAGTALIALVAAVCGDENTTTGATAPESTTAGQETAGQETTAPSDGSGPGAQPGTTATFRAPGGSEEGGSEEGTAFTYDEAAVPAGSTVTVDEQDHDGTTTVTLDVNKLTPDRDFGVHVHTKPCGPEPSDSGPHYQNEPDPAATPDSPSTDPAYANPQNEVWLDITTDAQGAAHATTTVDWEFRDGEANSLVLHEKHTMTSPGHAGTAGDRLACVDVDF